jgi:hypothetical protein
MFDFENLWSLFTPYQLQSMFVIHVVQVLLDILFTGFMCRMVSICSSMFLLFQIYYIEREHRPESKPASRRRYLFSPHSVSTAPTSHTRYYDVNEVSFNQISVNFFFFRTNTSGQTMNSLSRRMMI